MWQAALSADDVLKVSLSLDLVTPAMQAIERRARTAALRWGVTEAQIDSVSIPAKAADNPAKWFPGRDYPKGALRAGVSGVVVMVWTLDPAGRVIGCRGSAAAGAQCWTRHRADWDRVAAVSTPPSIGTGTR